MGLAIVRKLYGVPAKRGGRVIYTGSGKPEYGSITSADGAHLNIRLDGMKHTMSFHPTWELEYIDTARPTGDKGE